MPRTERHRYEQATHTRALVSFHTHDSNDIGGLLASLDGAVIGPPGTASGDIAHVVAVSTQKMFGRSGTFTVQVKKPQTVFQRRSWLRFLRDPEALWCRIRFICDGQLIDTMLGIVDSVKETVTRTATGERAEIYEISGRDFGKVFETTEIFANLFDLEGTKSFTEVASAAMEQLVGTPSHFIRMLIEIWLGNNDLTESQWVMPNSLARGLTFFQVLRLRLQEMNIETHGELFDPNFISVDGMNGKKLWDTMSTYHNSILNEMWWDLAPRRDSRTYAEMVPTLYLRERPFPIRSRDGRTLRRRWDSIRTRVLELGDVTGRSIVKGGAANRYNYWQLNGAGVFGSDYGIQAVLQQGVAGVEPGRPGNHPIWNLQSIHEHGLRRWVGQTNYLPIARDDERAGWIELCARWLKKVHDWYAPAPFQLSGTLTTSRVMPEIRIGERIKEERREGKVIYYCEGVAHEWSYPGAGRTSLTVTRGEYEGDDLLHLVYEQFTNPRTLTAPERCMITEDTPLEEIEDMVRRGCGFEVAPISRPLVLPGFEGPSEGSVSELGDEMSVEDTQRSLQAERDGSSMSFSLDEAEEGDPAVEDPEMFPQLDDSDGFVPGESLPDPDAGARDQDAPLLDQERLEQERPINDDPLGGIEEFLRDE